MPIKSHQSPTGSKTDRNSPSIDPLEKLRRHIVRKVRVLLPTVRPGQVLINLKVPPSLVSADFCFSTFSLAELASLDPSALALTIGKLLQSSRLPFVKKVSVVGPYINLELNRVQFGQAVIRYAALRRKELAKRFSKKSRGTIIVDCTVPLSTHPLTIHDIRPVITAYVLANLYEGTGHSVIRCHYLNDWGTTAHALLYALFHWAEKVPKTGTDSSYYFHSLYDRFLYESDRSESIRAEAKLLARRINQGDKNLSLQWKSWQGAILKELRRYYKSLGIFFDIYQCESLFLRQADIVVKEISQRGKVSALPGSNVIVINSLGDSPPALLQRQDLTKTVLARKLAASQFLVSRYFPKTIVYIMGHEAETVIQQLVAITKTMVYLPFRSKLDHVLVGKATTFPDIVAAQKIKSHTRKVLTRAALLFSIIRQPANKNIIFHFDQKPDKPSRYFLLHDLYSSLPKKLDNAISRSRDFNDQEFLIIKRLSLFPLIVQATLEQHAPHLLCSYLENVAAQTKEYLRAQDRKDSANYRLLFTVGRVLKNGMDLLGIKISEGRGR